MCWSRNIKKYKLYIVRIVNYICANTFDFSLCSKMLCVFADWLTLLNPAVRWPRPWPSSAAVPTPSSTRSPQSLTSGRTASLSWLDSLRAFHKTRWEIKRAVWQKTRRETVTLTPVRYIVPYKTGRRVTFECERVKKSL